MQEVKFEWVQLGLEQSFQRYISEVKPKTDREFISFEWSDFYFKNLFEEKPNLEIVQNILDKLDTSKKYFTVVEIEEGIVNDYSKLDLLILSPGGNGHIDIPYPIKPINYLNTERKTLCSFMGSTQTHPIREEMFEFFKNEEGFEMWKSTTTSMYEYQLSSTIFSLCPRGRGPGSYRFYESIYMGAIPIYISDIFLTPFKEEIDWDKLCIMVKLEDINEIPKILRSKTKEDIERYQQYGKEVYENFFKFDNLCKKVINLVNSN